MPRKVGAQLGEAQLALFEVDALDKATRTPKPPSSKPAATSRNATVQPDNELSPAAPPRESPAGNALLSPEDVARRCGLSRKAVYRAVSRGELRAARILSRLRIDPGDVETWIRANIVDARCPAPAPTPSRVPATIGLRRLLPEP